jgi:APA family basic amino acid/polyamine antiporter
LHGLFNVPAAAIILLLTALLVRGTSESTVFNNVIVAIKVTVVLFVIFFGAGHVQTANWSPLVPENSGEFGVFGWSGVVRGASVVFFAYIGLDSVSTAAQEARKPQRDVPIGIIASLVLCTILYFGVSAVITGMEPYPVIDTEAAVAEAFHRLSLEHDNLALKISSALIAVGALAGMTSVILITLLSQARIFLAMARDGLLPPAIFGAVHAKFRTPHLSTMLTGGILCVLTAVAPMDWLFTMVNIGTLLAFTIVCAAVMILRLRRPDAHRPFRCPVVYVVAPLGIAVNLLMMLFLPVNTWLRLVVWLALGMVIYFAYGRRHSAIGRALAEQG